MPMSRPTRQSAFLAKLLSTIFLETRIPSAERCGARVCLARGLVVSRPRGFLRRGMNIMLVSVTQRTREIGLRLAVGATEADVQLQFLSEAIALSILGGLFGLLAGVVSSVLVERLFQMPTQLSPGIFAIGGVFSASI